MSRVKIVYSQAFVTVDCSPRKYRVEESCDGGRGGGGVAACRRRGVRADIRHSRKLGLMAGPKLLQSLRPPRKQPQEDARQTCMQADWSVKIVHQRNKR